MTSDRDDKPLKPLHPLKQRMDDVPYWCDDICCCEPEPRWQKLAEEIGIDLTARDRHAQPTDSDAENPLR